MTQKKRKFKIDKERCKGCLLCVETCPQKALVPADEVSNKGLCYVVLEHPEKCTGCGMCVLICPDCAIEIINE